MMYEQQRTDVIETCRELARTGLVIGTAGNVSMRVSSGHVVVSASALPYDAMSAADVSVVDLEGRLLEGEAMPTSELQLHLAVYRNRSCGAVVHTHSSAAVAVGMLVPTVPAVHYYLHTLGGRVDVAPYATYGTVELAKSVVDALGDSSHACLMANHGATATGTDLGEAVYRAGLVEWLCDVWLRASAVGTPRLLEADDLAKARERQSRNVYEELGGNNGGG